MAAENGSHQSCRWEASAALPDASCSFRGSCLNPVCFSIMSLRVWWLFVCSNLVAEANLKRKAPDVRLS